MGDFYLTANLSLSKPSTGLRLTISSTELRVTIPSSGLRVTAVMQMNKKSFFYGKNVPGCLKHDGRIIIILMGM